MGQIVEQHGEGFQTSGSYNYTVNTANYAAGTYFYTMTVNGASFTKKMMVK